MLNCMYCGNSQWNGNGGDDPEVRVHSKTPQYDDDQDDNKIKVKEDMAFEKSNIKAANLSKHSCHETNHDDLVDYEN